jgi:hypothetical protein
MAKKKQPKPASVPIEAHKHVADKRSNIPARKTAAFAKKLDVYHHPHSED